jgi:hypothetical protein
MWWMGDCASTALSAGAGEVEGLAPRKSASYRILLILAIATFGFFVAHVSSAEAPAGSISDVQGHAELKRGSATMAVTAGMPVEIHDRIATSSDCHLILSLADGSRLSLSESSVLVIDEHLISAGTRARSVVSLLDGRLRNLVSTTLGGVFNYEVHTSNSIIAVGGTDFEVEFAQGAARPGFSGCAIYTDVRVNSGLVRVANAAEPGTVVSVQGGYATTVPCGGTPLSPGPLGLAGRGVQPAPLGAAAPPECPVCMLVRGRLR